MGKQSKAKKKIVFVDDQVLNLTIGRNVLSNDYDVITAPSAEKIKKNAARKPTQRTIDERPELYKEYDKFAKENKEFLDIKVLQKSHTRFFMQKEQILEDAIFALAKATNSVKNSGVSKQLDQMRIEQQKIDDEIERLRLELEESQESEE